MSIARTKEHDAFGPWVYEIDDKHELPPLFASYTHLKESALMMFKIPRHIERRNARPDMHLYDAVIGIFEDYILTLYRYGNSIKEQRISYRNLQAIDNTQCILSGKLMLFADTKIYTINYNTVSQEVVTKAISIIRKQQPLSEYTSRLKPMYYDTNNIEYLYVNLLSRLKKSEPDTELVAYQPSMQLPKKKGLTALFQTRPSLTCSAFVSNKKEIIIISRISTFKKQHENKYSYTYTYLPISQIKSAKRSVHDEQLSIYQLTLSTPNHKFSVLYNTKQQNIIDLYDELR